ncbi:hypothetical protein RA16_06885 [Levilactobacillus brevis]|uniref:hypothetical protein n=1 Tax=Levilactobacillus brevis TaxID=1580 RepID=UPI0005B622C2|nr:hypothetical protein [Levilactobacillus brevis]KIR08695.1 hypothetical protein RA16_06885 [Levilactobacillus brevis]
MTFMGLEIGSWSNWVFGLSSFFLGVVSLHLAVRNPKLRLTANSYKKNGKIWAEVYNASKGEGVVKIESDCDLLNESATLWYPIHAKGMCIIELMSVGTAQNTINRNSTIHLKVCDDRKSSASFELKTVSLSSDQEKFFDKMWN